MGCFSVSDGFASITRARTHIFRRIRVFWLSSIVVLFHQNLNLSRLEKIHDVALLGSPIILSLPPSWHWFYKYKVPNFFFLRVAPYSFDCCSIAFLSWSF